MSQPAPDWVAYHATRSPQSLALESVDTGATLTWAALEQDVARVAGYLVSLGISAGDRVVVVAENDPRVFVLQFACMRLGAIHVPLNWRLAPSELEALCTDADPRLVVHDGAWTDAGQQLARLTGAASTAWQGPPSVPDFDAGAAGARPMAAAADRTFDDPTHILYTSGTTGRPKGALVTNGTLFWQWANAVPVSALTGYGSKYLNPLPLFHAGGLTTLAAPVHRSGGCVAVARRFDPEQCLTWLADPSHGVTHFNAPPIMWQSMSELSAFDNADLSRMHHAHVAGSIMPLELFARWHERGLGIQQHYGGTEMGPSATALPASDVARKPGSCGLPVMHTKVRLVDDAGDEVAPGRAGEIWLDGPSVTPGYWRRGRPEESFDGRWFRTGDGATQDDDGYLYIADRLKDMFKSGGESIFPAEIERILMELPSVAEVAVIGVADARWGEVGRAIVVPHDGTEVTLDEVSAKLDGRVARYKIPKSLTSVAALPRNALGKVDKKALRAQHGS